MKEVWNQTLSELKAELAPHTFNTWLKPLQFQSSHEEQIVVEVPNTFYRDRLQQEFAPALRNRLRQIARSGSVDLSFVLPSTTERSGTLLRDISRLKKEFSKQAKRPPAVEGLNARYEFSSFVVGSSNEFAHAAALAVAQAPAQTYNPLFVYGGVGLGKTHLISAIGNHAAKQDENCRIVYRTAEQFMNELINSIRYEKTVEFRSRYREGCDILIIDDIQFIGGKERTQEEFFHTFNSLHEANKQIILSSDETPSNIPNLDERLRSRFQWGLQCDIQPPDVETRVAILKKKAEAHQVTLSDNVALFLATHITSNVRVLEGSLIRLAAFASLTNREISLELTQEVFPSLASEERSISVEMIQKRVAEFFHLHVADLRSSRRHKTVALPRQIAMYLGRKLTSSSFPELGSRFGGKDHTTVMHAVQKIDRLLLQDTALRKTITTIEQEFTA